MEQKQGNDGCAIKIESRFLTTEDLRNNVDAKEEVIQNSFQPKENYQEYDSPQEGVLLPKIMNKLNDVIKSKGILDYTIEVDKGSNLGDNFLGFIGKVTVKGSNKSKEHVTLEWIVKTAPNTEVHRKIMKVELLYAREIYMYQVVFPTFAQLQAEKSVLRPFNQHATFVFSYMEPFNESFAMENLKVLGYVMRNRQEPLDYNHVKLVMEAYAKMHALSYCLKDQRPEEFSMIKDNMKDVLTDGQDVDETYKQLKFFMEKALKALNPETDSQIINKFKKFVENFVEIFQKVVNTTNQYSVFGHGDSWVNNMLWKYDDKTNPNKPTNVCLLDFQLARYGSPVCDLSYFIFTCTEQSVRDLYYNNMIKHYYYTLCSHMNEMGSDPEIYLPFSALENELKTFSVVGLYWTVMVLSIITKNSDEIPNFKEGNKSQEEMAEEFLGTSKNEAVFEKRVRDVIVDFCEKGYLDFLT